MLIYSYCILEGSRVLNRAVAITSFGTITDFRDESTSAGDKTRSSAVLITLIFVHVVGMQRASTINKEERKEKKACQEYFMKTSR